MTDREKVIKRAERIMCSTVDRDMIDSFCEDVISLLKKQDAVVRCKDCKYEFCINPNEKEKIYECMKYPIANLRITHKPEWFCADGERKES